ncbi:NAD(P)H-dependent oxidoreductase [Nocardioides piscis]|uniref:Flavodoxin family protein n=1 Tax=Nocardioides piscis TaxID=2714938 RepID=A0A6G7YC80_9ACTN|nr:NAD(P)H-dependent oxidoreductase [Nocardioides piscis]QIK74370.1 flavodoxin family protein [Nocardioides piscis]
MSQILVVDGHPDPDSLTAATARAYVAGADGQAILLAVRDLAFDPDLRAGYRAAQPTEPDLARARSLIEESEHITVLTPVWWGSVPAALKGFFDRALDPGWAYRYNENGRPEGLLGGRTGRLVVLADSPRWYLPLVGDTTVKQVRRTTLEFCGIKPVAVTRFTDVRSQSEAERVAWLGRCAALGAADADQRRRSRTVRDRTAAHAPSDDETTLA